MSEFERIYPNLLDFVNSTAAARVNGYLHGNGKAADFEREAASLGLSENALKYIRGVPAVKNQPSPKTT